MFIYEGVLYMDFKYLKKFNVSRKLYGYGLLAACTPTTQAEFGEGMTRELQGNLASKLMPRKVSRTSKVIPQRWKKRFGFLDFRGREKYNADSKSVLS